MHLIVHTAIGATVAAAATRDPVAAGVIALVLHYVGDACPHGDEVLDEWVARGNQTKRYAMVGCVDTFILLSLLTVAFWRHWDQGTNGVLLAAAIGSCLPDALWLTEMICGRRLFGPTRAFHDRVHNYFRIRWRWQIAWPVQAAITAGLWYLIVS